MGKSVQIRNVPEGVHRNLKVRAAQAGKSLSDYLLEEVIAFAEKPPVEEILRRAGARRGDSPSIEMIVEAVRAGRER